MPLELRSFNVAAERDEADPLAADLPAGEGGASQP